MNLVAGHKQRNIMKENSSLVIERQIRLDVIYGYKALNIAIFYMNRCFTLRIYHLGKVYEK